MAEPGGGGEEQIQVRMVPDVIGVTHGSCMRWRAASAPSMTSEKEIAITKAKIIHFLHSLPISSIPTLTFNTLHTSIHFPFIHIK